MQNNGTSSAGGKNSDSPYKPATTKTTTDGENQAPTTLKNTKAEKRATGATASVPSDVLYADMTPEQKAIVRMWAKLRVPTECRYSEYQSKDWSMANVEEFFEADEARLSKHYFRRPR